jgi:periplasmic divalent cation tolerance protein
MNTSRHARIALVSVPDVKTGRQLAQAALENRLAACANILPKLESHYWWQGKLESSPECLILFKTTSQKLAALEDLILDQHPYDTPEFVVIPILAGSSAYLNWLTASVTVSD